MRITSRLVGASTVSLAFLLCVAVGLAFLLPGTIFRPPGTQWYVRGAHNSTSNEYFVVWADNGAGNSIRGFRLTSSGARHATDPDVKVIDAGPSIFPAIAYNPNDNEYLVVWSDGQFDFGDISARFLNGSGDPIGSEFSIFQGAGAQGFPRVAYNPEDNLYMVVWSRCCAGGRVSMQMVSGNSAERLLIGSTVAMEVGTSSTPLHPHSAQLAWNAFTNKFFVAWTATDGEDLVRGQIFNGDGTAASGVLTVTDGKIPSVAANSRNGEFLIAFDRGIGRGLDVLAVIFDSTGTRLKAPFVISSTGGGIPDFRNHASYNALANSYLVTYTKGRACGFPCDDVLGKTVAPDGTVGPVIGIANDNFLQTHGSDDGFGSWGGLVSSATQPDFMDLYQVNSDDINAGIVSFSFAGAAESSLITFDGDAKNDVAIWRPSDGNWWVLLSGGGVLNVAWGSAGDTPVPDDYDGDGLTDVAVYSPGTSLWSIFFVGTGLSDAITWGLAGDMPVPGDYTGDGIADLAVYRPSDGTWWIRRSEDQTTLFINWGSAGDIPIPADYDGDGKVDVAIYRPSDGTWWILRSSNQTLLFENWGRPSDLPVPADYTGDGKADVAVYRPSDGTWWILRSGVRTLMFVDWGSPGDIPVPADYSGDGKADVAIFRPVDGDLVGTWYILRSENFTLRFVNWGNSTDVPVSSRMWWTPLVP